MYEIIASNAFAGQTSLSSVYWCGSSTITSPADIFSGSTNKKDYNCPCSSVAASSTVCHIGISENDAISLTCPTGSIISAVNFASFGSPTGSCGSFVYGSCHLATSTLIIEAACLGKSSCSLSGTYFALYGDPCSGTSKKWLIQVTCAGKLLNIFCTTIYVFKLHQVVL